MGSTVTASWIGICILTMDLMSTTDGINWNGNNWALGCDFKGSDLRNVQISAEKCGGKCAETSGCTHFTWTVWNGGTCWMKAGSVTKDQASATNDQTMVCGVKSGSRPQMENELSVLIIDAIKRFGWAFKDNH